MEHFQWKSPAEIEKYAKTHKNEIAEELADVAAYLGTFGSLRGGEDKTIPPTQNNIPTFCRMLEYSSRRKLRANNE